MVKTRSLPKPQFLHVLKGDTVSNLHFLRLLGGLKMMKSCKMLNTVPPGKEAWHTVISQLTPLLYYEGHYTFFSKGRMTDEELRQAIGCLHKTSTVLQQHSNH